MKIAGYFIGLFIQCGKHLKVLYLMCHKLEQIADVFRPEKVTSYQDSKAIKNYDRLLLILFKSYCRQTKQKF